MQVLSCQSVAVLSLPTDVQQLQRVALDSFFLSVVCSGQTVFLLIAI